MKHTLTLLSALLLAPLAALYAADVPEPTAQPNLVIIFTDDMGYADLGCYGGKDIPTPHIDRLAAEGARFTSAYTVAPICVPSRMGLMSGKFSARFGIFTNVYSPEENQLWMQQTTLADVLKARGYRTANVGKWHLSGNSSGHSGDDLGGFQFKPPHERGFDEFVGITGGMHAFWKGTELARLKDGKYQRFESPDYLTDFFGTEACEFIQRQKDGPFFLYLAFNAPHAPLHGLDEDQAAIAAAHISPDRRTYAAMVRAIDRNVGRVMDKLRELGLADNTLTVFANDNGGGGNNAGIHTRNTAINIPYRGHKFDLWEGGVRVPFIMHWPGQVPAGQTFDRIVSTVDVFPTFAKVANATMPGNLDGVDLMPFMQGRKTGNPHDTLCWQQRVWIRPNERKPHPAYPVPAYNLAIRSGPWKAIKLDQPFDGTNDSRAWELYDLSRDPAELNDLATEFPEKVKELSAAFFAWQQQMPKPVPLTALHAAEPVTIDLAKRTWQGIPGLERTAKGRVFVSWFTGGTKEPEPENTVVLSHSDDGGKTFSVPQAMGLPLNDGTRCYDPCLWIDPKGRLWYLFNRSIKDSTRHGVYARICDAPDASLPVWGAEFRVGFDSPFSFRLNKPVALSTGEWVLPVVHALEPLTGWAGFDPKQVFGAAVSTDEGKTWKLHGAIKTAKAGLENMIVELKDGRLWMLIRTEKVLWESHSSDKGRTWTPGRPTTIATPHSRFFIRRLASGNLLLVNHYKFTGRNHLTAQISTDDGKTWNDGLLLDGRSGVSYPDGVQDKDGLIWITYDRDRGGAGEILLAKFKEEDVAAGKNVSVAGSLKRVVNKLNEPAIAPKPSPTELPASIRPAPKWTLQAAKDAKQDFTSIPFDGTTPNKLACDTTLRELPDGSWVMVMLGGGDTEPLPENHVLLTRSHDKGKTWSPMQPLHFGFPREGDTIAMVPSELMIHAGRCTLFFATHDGNFAGWKEWMTHSEDSCRTWSKPAPAPGRLHHRTFIRNHIVTRDGRMLLPFQHYLRVAETKAIKGNRRFSAPTDPRNGVLISSDGGKTWTEHGDIRITPDDRYHGWAENNIAELADGRIAMIIRADRLGGALYYAESKDGGTTWPEFAVKSDIPNPGSKATLYPLGGDTVALLHNPNPKGRHPLALWISFDGMKTWPYQRVLVEHSSDGPGRSLNYPDGFGSKDKQWLHFAYDDNRHRAVHYSVKLPPLP